MVYIRGHPQGGGSQGSPFALETAMRTTTLEIVQTSAACIRYRLLGDAGHMLWQNRVYNRPEGHAGARARMAAWAVKHGYRIIEQQPRKQSA